MTSVTTPVCQFGLAAPDFSLQATDGQFYSLAAVQGSGGLLVMFICNHCPYVKAIREELVKTCQELQRYGIGCVAINSNDPTAYPDDDFENMKAYAKAYHFSFPYLYDETQDVARAYGAMCTPDFFGYNSDLQLQYRGRFNDSGRTPGRQGSSRDLFEAMKQIAMTGEGPRQQVASIGCSIKWRRA